MPRPKEIKKLKRIDELDDPEDVGDKPRKQDGSHWTSLQDRAAQMRALDYTWGEIADKLDSTEGSLSNLAGRHPNFRDLIDWYRTYFFSQKLDQLMRVLWPEALSALHKIVSDVDRVGTEDGPDYSDVTRAAETILRSTGFQSLQKTKKELQAQKEITGSPGETHQIQTDQDYDNMDEEQFQERLKHLEKLIDTEKEDEDDE